MFKKVAVVFCLWSLSCFSSLVLAQETHQALVDLLEKNRNVEGEFRQITYTEEGKELQNSEGVFLLAQPNRFVWDSISPFPQRIVSNGETVTIWDVDLEQATQRPLAKTVGNSPAALLSQPAVDVLPHYKVLTLAGNKYRLIPKDEDDLFQTLTLSFKGDLISAMSLKDALGQTTVIEFTNLEHHEGVSAENFKIDLPENVDLIVEQ
ncbi:outer membrane lipoprotein chaperone LolA [Marinomonas mediterranea]|uniref:Outer-membrane lipoprotein carrier protein n=1 Tax=Marinomonas mediterranea (strain ATCC 700492 / JCM 21426 / NBRC 103028 / MMB-1) TaxID=717774 RepID=F2JWE8_MARM1|nr:outer membrane lipoprotein chaperone LolA [Marinomonas mediterranea]ADZ90621.1 Outer-membrane lipoprotein carrier protein [Marinomonas mediterranea MMB-1]WCN08663.1 outer membrane lipoprotein chaperone LolA [Marinomonas mediterranea]WCN12718.1 outer membrane lipoprotein chaperone LolA [Marinomonas mediterranea]WCN16791.1 outer membrane lipoprotein chaperone LolA [Marinomonas mediterranea MMB-1]